MYLSLQPQLTSKRKTIYHKTIAVIFAPCIFKVWDDWCSEDTSGTFATTISRYGIVSSFVRMAFPKAGRDDNQYLVSALFKQLEMNSFLGKASSLQRRWRLTAGNDVWRGEDQKLGNQSISDGTHCRNSRYRLSKNIWFTDERHKRHARPRASTKWPRTSNSKLGSSLYRSKVVTRSLRNTTLSHVRRKIHTSLPRSTSSMLQLSGSSAQVMPQDRIRVYIPLRMMG